MDVSFTVFYDINFPALASVSSPDFAYDKLVEKETQREEDYALDEGGDEHPA